MSIIDECLARARACQDQGAAASCPESRADFLALEQEWRRMATRAALRARYWGLADDKGD